MERVGPTRGSMCHRGCTLEDANHEDFDRCQRSALWHRARLQRAPTRTCPIEERAASDRDRVPHGGLVVAAKAGQKTPDGYYNVERMLKRLLASKGEVLLCGTCMDARGLEDAALMVGARRSTMDELATATMDADKVLVF